MESFKPLIAKVAAGATLTRSEAESAFDSMLSGEVTPSQMGGFLMALRVRGETVEEITGAVAAMRAKMLSVKAPPDAIDIVGTGGDGSGSLNVSTLAAIITAACGRHGRQARQSRRVVAFRRRGHARRARRQDRTGARRRRALPRRSRYRLHDGADPPRLDAQRRPDPDRARHAHHRSIFSGRSPIRPASSASSSASSRPPGSSRWRRSCATSARSASG